MELAKEKKSAEERERKGVKGEESDKEQQKH